VCSVLWRSQGAVLLLSEVNNGRMSDQAMAAPSTCKCARRQHIRKLQKHGRTFVLLWSAPVPDDAHGIVAGPKLKSRLLEGLLIFPEIVSRQSKAFFFFAAGGTHMKIKDHSQLARFPKPCR